MEKAVVSVVKKTLLHNNIQLLARAVVKCCMDAQDNGELLRLQSELKTVNHAISNLLDLIEAGRTTTAIADRLDAPKSRRKNWRQPSQKKKF